MTRRNWDRVRRYRPLDGADPRLDPDGAILWERELGPDREGPLVSRFDPSFVVRRLRAGIIVRRARERGDERAGARASAAPAPSPPRPPAVFDSSAWVECPRCKARVPRRKLLLHARASCAR